MTADEKYAQQVIELLGASDPAGALESERFRHFLDQIPVAIAVAEIKDVERIIYANPGFEKLSGMTVAEYDGKPWTALDNQFEIEQADRHFGSAVAAGTDFIGTFRMEGSEGEPSLVDAYSNIIQDDDGNAIFRLAALVNLRSPRQARNDDLEKLVREKDTQLREIQHRVKNNLQMITALIRLETRNLPAGAETVPFDRLAGRIEALQLLYSTLSADETGQEIDLGGYLSQIASAVMRSHAVEGIRLDLKSDVFLVSVNVALPAGLVVNELLINALKHAFDGRDGGTITLHCLTDNKGCHVVVADDGVGLPDGVEWPKPGKLSSLIVQSLRENAGARLDIKSAPGQGTQVTITFARAAAKAEASG
ncbi:MAG TPA: histidine kinase dimerization/phosphoacceptor domain -containing protein [Aestuariivirgaceae bacterium]|nr:histidine kinase dimerization/phosphoacceptor domain -containing protein [Aestuariivirgaceae bacterium]